MSRCRASGHWAHTFASARSPFDDVYHDVDGLVFARHLLDVEVRLLDPVDPVQVAEEVADAVRVSGVGDESLHNDTRALLQQLRNVHPQRVVAHLERLVEREHFVAEVEAQVGERALVPFEEGGSLPADKAVERSDALLPVEQELHEAGRQLLTTPRVRRLCRRHPDQQAAHWVPQVQGLHQPSNLVSVPHVAALELRQRDAAEVDLVQSGDA